MCACVCVCACLQERFKVLQALSGGPQMGYFPLRLCASV